MENAFGNGQMQPSDTSSDANVIDFIIRRTLAKTRTMMIVKIVSVTNDGELSPVGFVDVQPLVNMLDGAGTSSPHGTVMGLPYFRLQGGTDAVIIDPKVGDIGFAVIADRDISAVKSAKAQANPGSFRRFDLSDGVYIGGILNGIPTQYIRFTETGVEVVSPTQINIQAPVILLNGAVQFLADVTGPGGGALNIPVDINSTGDITAGAGGPDAVGLKTHFHDGVEVGGGISGPPVGGT